MSVESAYWAIAALCLAFACVEVNEGNYWGVAMRLEPSDSMAATAVLNTGGNLGGVIGTSVHREHFRVAGRLVHRVCDGRGDVCRRGAPLAYD